MPDSPRPTVLVRRQGEELARPAAVGPNPAEVYIASLAKSGRPTIAISLNRVAAFISPGLDARTFPWGQMRYEHVEAIKAALSEEKYAPASINLTIAAIRSVARVAYNLGLIDSDSLARIRAVKQVGGVRVQKGREVRTDELRALFDSCASDGTRGARDAAALAIMFGAGLRRAEAASATTLSISVTEDGGLVRIIGKGNKERVVPLPGGALAAIRGWLAIRGDWPGPLLCSVYGDKIVRKQMTASGIVKAIQHRARLAGIKHFMLHDLRRSFITALWRSGVDAHIVAKLAGHSDIKTTMRYDMRGEEGKREAVSKLDVPYPAK